MNEEDEPHDLTVEHEGMPDAAEAEREARRYGWAPKERWRGDPKDFIEAPEYLRRAREHLPIVKGLLSKEQEARQREKAEYDARIFDFERRLTAQQKMQARNLDLQKQALIERYEEEKRQALSLDDPGQRQAAYDGATKREREAFGRIVAEERDMAPPAAQQQPGIAPEIQAWGANNPWVNYVPQHIRQEAVSVMAGLEANEPDTTIIDKLERVTETIQSRHPEWFPPKQERRPAVASAVEGGNSLSRSGRESRARGFKDLPSEAKHEFNEMLRQGYLRPMSNEDAAKARVRLEKEYAANYWTDYGE